MINVDFVLGVLSGGVLVGFGVVFWRTWSLVDADVATYEKLSTWNVFPGNPPTSATNIPTNTTLTIAPTLIAKPDGLHVIGTERTRTRKTPKATKATKTTIKPRRTKVRNAARR